MSPPNVIFLNGASSSGKSSIAKLLQANLPGVWMHLGIDHALQMAPLKIHGVPEGVQLVPQPDGSLPIQFGPDGYEVEFAFHRMARAIAEGGTGVIVDDVLIEVALLDHWLVELSGFNVFFVGVRCSLEEGARRELKRGDRGVGQVLAQHVTVHRHGIYDLEIDTTAATPAECAAILQAALADRRAPSAFDVLRGRRD